MLLTVIGYLIIFLIVFLLIKEKASLPPIFILIPVLGAAICGFSIREISGFIADGISLVLNTAILFIFSILYFSILGESGIFNLLAKFMMQRMKNNLYFLLLLTYFMAVVIQMDGSGAMTMLIIIPMMLPIYDKMKVKREALVCVCAAGAGVMNILPWCSSMLRVSAGTGVDAQRLWKHLMMVQCVTFLIGIFITVLIAQREKRKKASVDEKGFRDLQKELAQSAHLNVPVWVAVTDIIFTVLLILLLVRGSVDTTMCFMVGLSVLLLLNYPHAENQEKIIKKFSATAFPLVTTIFAIGVMLGILQGSGMIEAIAKSFVNLLPDKLGPLLLLIYGIFGVPVSMVLGSDCCYSILAPLLGTISQYYGGGMLQAASVIIITSSMAASISFVGPVPYMTVGLAQVSMRDNVKYSFRYLWLMGVLAVGYAAATGVI